MPTEIPEGTRRVLSNSGRVRVGRGKEEGFWNTRRDGDHRHGDGAGKGGPELRERRAPGTCEGARPRYGEAAGAEGKEGAGYLTGEGCCKETRRVAEKGSRATVPKERDREGVGAEGRMPAAEEGDRGRPPAPGTGWGRGSPGLAAE